MNELAVISNREVGTFFTSIENDGTYEKKALAYKASNSPDFRGGEIIGKTIECTDIYVEIMQATEDSENGEYSVVDETGEVVSEKFVSMVFIDTEGKSYQTSSKGIFKALKLICNIFGMPHWEEPIKMTFVEKSIPGTGKRFHTIEL